MRMKAKSVAVLPLGLLSTAAVGIKAAISFAFVGLLVISKARFYRCFDKALFMNVFRVFLILQF